MILKKLLILLVLPITASAQEIDSTAKNFIFRRQIELALQNEEYQKSITYLDSLITLEPAFDLLYNLRGYCYVYRGPINDSYNDSCAISDFNKAIALNPEISFYLHNRADVYVIKDKYKLAERDFHKALELDPNNLKFLQSVLKIKLLTKQYTLALQLADELIEKYPNDGYAYYIRGNLKRDFLKKYVEGNVDVKKGNELGWNGGFGLILNE